MFTLPKKARIIFDMSDMNTYRSEIDRIDAELQRLFEARMDVSKKIGAYKASHGMPVFDGEREAAKLKGLRAAASSREYADGIERLYRELFAISRDAQRENKVKQ